jgi:hypothetical protein
MTTSREYDDEQALLAALGHRHANTLPLRASICLSAAVDELTDALTVPPLVDVDTAATSDPRAVIEGVRVRLLDRARTTDGVGTALSCARAARELRNALRFLDSGQTGDVR